MLIHPSLARRTLLAAGLVWSVLASTPSFAAETPTSIPGVTVITAEVAKKMQDSGAPMIDARVPAEFAEKTIKGAKNVPYKEKSEKAIDYDASKDSFDLSKLPADKAKPIVFFCNGPECWKSYKAATTAKNAGYSKVYLMRGGFPEWSSKGLPTE